MTKKKPLKISKDIFDQLKDIGIDMLDECRDLQGDDSSRYCLFCKDLQLSAFPYPEKPWIYHCYTCGGAFIEH